MREFGKPYQDYMVSYSDSLLSKHNNGSFYHYTTVNNSLNMLDHKEDNSYGQHYFEFWASNQNYLNDKKEHIDGCEKILKELRRLKRSVSNDDLLTIILTEYEAMLKPNRMGFSSEIYLLCFCKNGNLLSQWKYYGKSSGIAIEYDFNNIQICGNTENHSILMQQMFPIDVVYSLEGKQALIQEYMERIKAIDKNAELRRRQIEGVLDELLFLCPLFKDSEFEEEQEARLIISPLYYANPFEMCSHVHYRERNGTIIPFLKIRLVGDINIIKSITIGPGPNQEQVYEGIKHYVQCKLNPENIIGEKVSNNQFIIGDILVKKSTTPFRE